ncbi:hypothetical protein LA471_000818 [Campylobacter jejuni]|nr:hypothetical protein [Campylobacter jejuni]
MYRYLLFVLAAFFLAACGSSKINVVYPDYTKYKSNDFDLRVMKAYNYEYYKQYKEARDEFLSLYQDYNNTNFLENAFLLTLANNLDKQAELDNLAKPYLNQNDNLKRLSALYALNSNDINNAQKLMKELLTKKDSDPRNLELYGDILVKKNDLKNATNLIIDANDLDNWFPKIFFLDKNLNLIKAVKSENKNNHFSELIPNGAIYAIVSDMYSLDNIRRGLKITLKK